MKAIKMSRWSTEFLNHPLHQFWKELKVEVPLLKVDDETVTTSVEEVARLKKIIVYLGELFGCIDPEITPRSVWAAFLPQAQACLDQVRAFSSNRNIAHVIQANEHADNLLTYLKPYLVDPAAVVSAIQQTAQSYAENVGKDLTDFRNKTSTILHEIEANQERAAFLLTASESSNEKIGKFADEILNGLDGSPSIEKNVRETKIKIDEFKAGIDSFHSLLLVGEASTRSTIELVEKEVKERHNEIVRMLEKNAESIKEFDKFYFKIFGELDAITGNFSGGLKEELDNRTAQLSTFEHIQADKQSAMFVKIESLLPGATSAGLASAYGVLSADFKKQVAQYTRLFYGSLTALIVGALIMLIERISIYPILSISLVSVKDWDFIVRALVYKVPFIAPVVWFALFSAKRRSQYERLQQEYAHKAAFASSYESYKKQLQELPGDNGDLQKILIGKAVDAIAYNASVTLDGKHEEKLPIHQLLEKVNIDDFKKLLEIIKGKEKKD